MLFWLPGLFPALTLLSVNQEQVTCEADATCYSENANENKTYQLGFGVDTKKYKENGWHVIKQRTVPKDYKIIDISARVRWKREKYAESVEVELHIGDGDKYQTLFKYDNHPKEQKNTYKYGREHKSSVAKDDFFSEGRKGDVIKLMLNKRGGRRSDAVYLFELLVNVTVEFKSGSTKHAEFYGLFVGMEQWVDDAEKMTTLFKEVLKYPESNVQTLFNPTQKILIDALKDFKSKMAENKQDGFIFFYSGHGTKKRTNKKVFQLDLSEGSKLDFPKLTGIINDFSNKVTYIIDACYSGAVTYAKAGDEQPPEEEMRKFVDKMVQLKPMLQKFYDNEDTNGNLVLAASRAKEKTKESVLANLFMDAVRVELELHKVFKRFNSLYSTAFTVHVLNVFARMSMLRGNEEKYNQEIPPPRLSAGYEFASYAIGPLQEVDS